MLLAQLLFVITGGGSLLLLVALVAVVIRRGIHEKRARSDKLRAAAFRKAVLPLIGRRDVDPVMVLEAWRRDPVALDAAGHLLQLLRGAERDRLLHVVEALDLLDLDHELARLVSANMERRVAIIRKLGGFPAPRVEAALKQSLQCDPAQVVRLEAGLALVRLGSLPSVEEAIAALDDGSCQAPAHRIIFRALAAHRPLEMIGAWSSHGECTARFAIVDALGDAFHPGALAVLRTAILDPDPQMRCEGLRSARRLGHPSMAPAVLAALADPEWIVRVQAASAAGAMRLVQARPRLHALLSDPQWWVRYRASEALTALHGTAPARTASA